MELKWIRNGWAVRILFGHHQEDGEFLLRNVYESLEDAETAFNRYKESHGEFCFAEFVAIKFISK